MSPLLYSAPLFLLSRPLLKRCALSTPSHRDRSSKFRTLDRARDAVCAEIRHQPLYRKQSLDRRRLDADNSTPDGASGRGGWAQVGRRVRGLHTGRFLFFFVGLILFIFKKNWRL